MDGPEEQAASAIRLTRKLAGKGILALAAISLATGIALSIAATPLVLWIRWLNSL